MRFYLKVIEPNIATIEDNSFHQVPLSTMPGLDAQIGLQFEVLLLQNRSLLFQQLGISAVDIVRSGPYRQTKTTTQEGCQIDYLIQTKTNSLFICEFKFRRREINSDIIHEMREKMARLKAPKGFAKVPVLFHLGPVSESLATSAYFYRMVDMADFVEEK